MDIRRVLPKDSIQSIDEPTFSADRNVDAEEQVLVIEPEDGPARAYPKLILNYHEIVNDSVDDTPIAITWCPLCGSAVVYERSVDGEVLTFGVSGKLADDDLVMYDRESESEWKQSTGACIDGPFTGVSLEIRPAGMMPFERFAKAHPDGLVLERPDGPHPVVIPAEDGGELTTETTEIDYSVDHFAEYVESDWLGSRSRESARAWNRTDIAAKEIVLGIEVDDGAIGIPQSRVAAVERVSVGDVAVVVFDVDGELHAFEAPGFTFEQTATGTYLGDGTEWDGATGQAADGRALDRIPARRLFAFAWQADHGPDAFYLGT